VIQADPGVRLYLELIPTASPDERELLDFLRILRDSQISLSPLDLSAVFQEVGERSRSLKRVCRRGRSISRFFQRAIDAHSADLFSATFSSSPPLSLLNHAIPLIRPCSIPLVPLEHTLYADYAKHGASR
jgi:hypothetical protein